LPFDGRFRSKEQLDLQPVAGHHPHIDLTPEERCIKLHVGTNDATTAAAYGWINRAFPDADLDAFVDNLARRIATFDRQALELAKRNINSRVTMPSESERWLSMQSFLYTTTWLATRACFGKSLDLSLQQRSDCELNLGATVVKLRPEYNQP
jgi:hypothetical protein